MVIKTGKELVAAIYNYMFMTDQKNMDVIAKKRNVTPQSVSSFFNRDNPTINSVLETLDALNAELHIEIKKKGEE